LRNAISNGYFFASPFTPSYIDRANASLLKQSQNGIFTFTNYNRMASGFSGSVGSSEIISQKGYSAPNALTITGWFYSSAFENNYQFPIDSNPEANWRIGFNSANTIFFDPGSHNDVSLSATVSYNKWYFVALTAQNSGTSTNWVFYLNGVNVGSGTVSSNIQSVNSIVLGDYAYPFVGQLANVQIYNKSLQPQQIQQLYQNGISAPPIANAGLVGWWPLNGNANDYSGFGNNGTATNVRYSLLQNYQRDSIFITPIPTTLQPIPGIMSCDTVAQCNNASLSKLYIGAMPLELQNKFEEAANFNGQSSYIEQQNGFAFMNNAIQPFSISIWVDPASSGGVIVDELGQLTPNTGWHDSWIELVNGNVYIRVWSLSCVSLGAIPLKQWSNIVMTGSISGNTITYSGYINGVFKNSGSGSRSVPGGTALMYYPLGTADSTNCGSGAYFSGSMSNYQIYNTSLSANNIQALYTEGIAGVPISNAGLVGWWPLNGNANDYSGFGNNGTATNVFYQRISPQYNLPGLSTITIAGSEQQVLGLG
ncbi:MAG: LamG domain-containing protein, partial [Candidatus Micrarchaeaceae archaeon]